MKTLTKFLIVLVVIFWIFRVAVCFMSEYGLDFMGIEPLNAKLEIGLLFVTLLSIVLMAKGKIAGTIIYLVSNILYFGTDFITKISIMIENESLTIGQTLETICSIIGIILPCILLINMIFDTIRKNNPVDSKTDWFYKNKDLDRKLDDRADKNNYRTM